MADNTEPTLNPNRKRQAKKRKQWDEMTKKEKLTGISTLVVGAIIVICVISAVTSGNKNPNSNGSALNTADTSTSNGSSNNADTGSQNNSNTSNNTPAPTPTPSNSIAAWHAKYGNSLTTLSDDMSAFGNNATNLNYAAVLTDCQKLNSDATADLNLPAIPDTNAAAHYSSGLTYSQQAAQQCIAAMNDNSVGNESQAITELGTSNSDITNAATQFNETAKIINQDTGN